VGYFQRYSDEKGVVKDIFLGTVSSIDFGKAMDLARSNFVSGKVKSPYYCIVRKSAWDNTEQILYENRPKENALEKNLKNV